MGVAASCSILSMCMPSVFLGSSLGLSPGNYQLASAEHQYQFPFEHPLSSGPSTQYTAVPSLGPASWLLPPAVFQEAGGGEAPLPLPGLQKGLDAAIEPSEPRRFQEQLFSLPL